MSSQNKTEYLKLSQFGNDDIPQWRTDYTGDMAIIDKAVKELTDISEELKKFVSDGKSKVASAITDKGVATEATDTFNTMAENIGKISGGGVVSKTNSAKWLLSNALTGIVTTATNAIQEV